MGPLNEVPKPDDKKLIQILLLIGQHCVSVAPGAAEKSRSKILALGIKRLQEAILLSDSACYFKSGADCRLALVRLKVYGGESDIESMRSILQHVVDHPSPAVSDTQREDAIRLRDSFALSDDEKRSIVAAMGSSGGYDYGGNSASHFFECPNGHPYFIGECGGAMQVGRCIECGAEVGGNSHRLLSNNRTAESIRSLF